MPLNKNYKNDDDDWLNSGDISESESSEDLNDQLQEASLDMDSILDLESISYKAGFERGKIDSKSMFYPEGQEFGRKQGLLIGFQFGEYLRKDPEGLYDLIAGKLVKNVTDGDEYSEWVEKIQSKAKVIELREKRKNKKPSLKIEREGVLDF